MSRAALVLATVLMSSCGGSRGAPSSTGWATAIAPSGTEFTLELATTPEQRRRGYMDREEVGPHEGMLFLFDDVDRHGIWMKNCLVPLDILWLDETFRIVHRVESAPPCPPDGECPSMVPPMRSRYVLELAAGASRSAGLEVGDRLVVLFEEPGP
jgi:uncharacterized membrane protein (UPF0127 family)